MQRNFWRARSKIVHIPWYPKSRVCWAHVFSIVSSTPNPVSKNTYESHNGGKTSNWSHLSERSIVMQWRALKRARVICLLITQLRFDENAILCAYVSCILCARFYERMLLWAHASMRYNSKYQSFVLLYLLSIVIMLVSIKSLTSTPQDQFKTFP